MSATTTITTGRCADPESMRRTLAFVEAHEDRWRQQDWATPGDEHGCGSAYCFGGWAVALSGGRIDAAESTVEIASLPQDVRARLAEILEPVERDRPAAYLCDAARAVFGLSESDADRLFAADNDLDALRRIVAEITTA